MPLRIAEPPPLETSPINWRREVQRWAPQQGSGGWTRPHFVWRTGYPYDSYEVVEPQTAQRSTAARTGVVKYGGGGFTPELYLSTAADEWGCGLWGYAGSDAESNVYIQVPRDSSYVAFQLYHRDGTWGELSINASSSWLYGWCNDYASNYLLKAVDETTSRLALWSNDIEDYASMYTVSGMSDLHGFGSNGTVSYYVSADGNSERASMYLIVDGKRGIGLSTDDMYATGAPNELYAMFRLVENCEGKQAFVLMTDWFDKPGTTGGGSGGSSTGDNTIPSTGGGSTDTAPPATYIPGDSFVAIKP